MTNQQHTKAAFRLLKNAVLYKFPKSKATSWQSDLYILFTSIEERSECLEWVKQVSPVDGRNAQCFQNEGDDRPEYPFGLDIPFGLYSTILDEVTADD